MHPYLSHLGDHDALHSFCFGNACPTPNSCLGFGLGLRADDLERLKKIRSHRGIRHYWGVRVRGQHTKTTGRRGRTVGAR